MNFMLQVRKTKGVLYVEYTTFAGTWLFIVFLDWQSEN
jgi:hypothetical protein